MIRHRSRGCFLLLLMIGVVIAIQARAERVEDIPNPKTRDNTWVTDQPGALQPETVQRLNAIISQLEQETSAEMAVVVINSLDGRSIEEFANELFNLWGIGKKNSDNGVLLLWSPNDRKVRIEVGYGLEDLIPDGKAGAILDNFVIPQFKAGIFDDGILNGVEVLATVIRKQPIDIPEISTTEYEEDETPIGWILGGLGLIPAGIGATVGFRRWRRYRKRRCPQCQTDMVRLDETEEDPYLDEAKQKEEKLRSVDYDVWKCPACSHHFTLRYPKWFSSYKQCPQCHNRTCSSTETTIRSATTSSSGLAKVTEDCEFCTYRRTYNRTIPRISTSSSSGGSSSSSSSSFGGGSSGGGGASRGY